jgi:xanthine dehydrogenase accessory factor
MQAVDTEVIRQIVQWLEASESCWLATVVATWGSSPRPVGSLFTCNRHGHVTGSLSGGCVEDDLLEQLQSGSVAQRMPEFLRYGVTAEETERLGLPCGGHLDIVVEPLNAVDHLEPFAHIAARLAERHCVDRTLHLRDARMSVSDAPRFEIPQYDADAQVLKQTYGPRYHLFIIGAGMVSQYLAEMALMLDYAVTVCDPRCELLEDFAVRGTHRVNGMPDDAIRANANDPLTAIVALTHDPRIDDMGLMEALRTGAFYVGAMGSSRTSAARRERLRALDLTQAEIARLHAPIGLPIGSKTPPEIAIAILAEITAIRQCRDAEARARLAVVAATA